MANNVSGANLNDIYNRLNNAPSSHPFDANTVSSDWSIEAGDVITVKRGDDEYESPLHSTVLTWKGAPEMTLSSTGSKERDAVSKVAKRKYSGGGGGIYSGERIWKEFTSSDGILHSSLLMTESILRTEFDNELSDVHSSIQQTAEYIITEVHAADSQIYSYVDQTATYIQSVVADVQADLGSAILQTAREIRSEVHASNSQLYSYVDQTATYIESVVADVEADLGSAILQTASQIRSEVHASNSQLYSYVDQTATYIESVVADVESSLGSSITQTATQIRSEVHAADSSLYSYVNQTATSISSAIASVASSLGSSITQTATQIRSEVHAADSSLYSYVDQTATSITTTIADVESSLGSSITQTATQIRSEVHAADSSLYSYVDQTATSISQTVADTASGLSSRITQQKDRIDLIVEGTGSGQHIKPAQIQASIDADSSSVISISASKIKLDGDTTLAGKLAIASGALKIEGNSFFNGDLTMASGKQIIAGEIRVGSGLRFPGGASASQDITIERSDIQSMIISASVDETTNTLTLVPKTGSPITFRKAASGGNKVSGSWSGATLTVAGSQTGRDSFATTITTGLVTDTTDPNNHTYHITAYKQDNDDQQVTELRSARTQYKLGTLAATPKIVRILNSAGTAYINGTATYTIPLQTKTVSANGTYTPAEDYIGFSSVTVSVNPTIGSTFVEDENIYYVSATKDGTEVTTARKQIALALNGTSVEIQDGRGTARPNTPSYTIPLTTKTITANGTYTPGSSYVGFSSTTVSIHPTLSGDWVNGTLTVTSSPSANDNYVRTLKKGTVSWDGTTAKIPINATYGSQEQYSESTDWSVSLDVSGKLQTKSVTANGTVTPDTGYIGLSSVNVTITPTLTAAWTGAKLTVSSSPAAVSNYTTTIGSTFVNANGTYYVSATRDSNELTATRKQIALSGSGSNIVITDGQGTKRSNTPSIALTLDTGTLNTETGQRTVTVKAGGTATTCKATIADYGSGYDAGTGAGQAAAGISAQWGEGSGANVLTVSRALSSATKSATYTITAGAPTATYSNSTHKYSLTSTALVNGTQRATGSGVTGTEAYDAGVNNGSKAAGIKTEWGEGSGANVLTVSRELSSGTKTATFTVTAGTPTGTYNSSTHKYTLTGTALVNSTKRATGTGVTGTEAYDAGVTAGKTAAGISTQWGTGSGSNVLTVSRALSSGTKTATFTVTAGTPTGTYNTSTHKYSLTGTALVNSTKRATGTGVTGTEAYDAGFEAGWREGWDAYRNDTSDWASAWSEGGSTYSVWRPKYTSEYDYYNSPSGRGKGDGSSTTSSEWFRYSTSTNPYTNTISVKQFAGYGAALSFVAYTKTNTGYTALNNGTAGYWYYSPTKSLGNTSAYKVLHY